MTRFRSVALIGIALLVSTAAGPAAADGWKPAAFDRPASVKKIPATSSADPLPEVICTTYPDFTIREQGTDSPAPDAAKLLKSVGPKKQACTREPASSEVPLQTEGFSFLGRKGQYLFFEASDPNGAIAFMVLSAETGQQLYTDATKTGGIQAMSLEHDALRLRYIRGFNGSCSILKDTNTCWQKLAKEGDFPAAIAGSAPPTTECAATYKKGKVPDDDPSIVTYEVALALDAAGKAEIASHGKIGCEPLP